MNDNEMLQSILNKLDKLDTLEATVNDMKADMNKRFDKVNDGVEDIDARFDVIGSNLAEMKEKIIDIDLSLRDTKLTIENDIKTSINVIAEQHLTTNEKLDDLMTKKDKLEYKVSMHDLQLLVQKEDIDKIKRQLATIA